ncbi:MAG: AAA family ATPase, partial [Deltaproteobacteria bacterium]|nr:AAA family ATPase [Deltaproteobacteria bacterium]
MMLEFPPFHADLTDERLWRDGSAQSLTRKAWAVLVVLLEAEGKLVTKDRLATTVWRDTHVSDASITKAIKELRRALGDDQRAPRFIATVRGRGYRFIAPLSRRAALPAARGSAAPLSASLVGRARERAVLRSWLEAALGGQRRIGFVSGEVGVGKSSLVDAVLSEAREAPARVAVGQCVEQFGEPESFLPVLMALRDLGRAPSAAAVLRAAAPSWLLGLCGLTDAAAARAAAGMRAGMLRTLAEAIEAVASQTPLVLVLEDLHWSDGPTLDLLNLLARRTEPAHLLVLATIRHADALAAGHDSARLVRELRRAALGQEVVVGGLAEPEIASYLATRLGDGELSARGCAFLRRHTGGNPFFLTALIDDLHARGSLRRDGGRWTLTIDEAPAIPSATLAALAQRLERLSEADRAMLEAASVVGEVFSVDVVAALVGAAGTAVEAVEAACEHLVQHQDLLSAQPGTPRYAFRHALYRQALYTGIPPLRRRRLHARAAAWLAAAPRSGGAAAEVARHFAHADDDAQAA